MPRLGESIEQTLDREAYQHTLELTLLGVSVLEQSRSNRCSVVSTHESASM